MTIRRLDPLLEDLDLHSAESKRLLNCKDDDATELGMTRHKKVNKKKAFYVDVLIAATVALAASLVVLIILGAITRWNEGKSQSVVYIGDAIVTRSNAVETTYAARAARKAAILELAKQNEKNKPSSSTSSSGTTKIVDKCHLIEIPTDEPIPANLSPFAPDTSEYASNVCIDGLMTGLGNRVYQYVAAFRYAFENKLAVQLPYFENDANFFPALRRFSKNCTQHAVTIQATKWEDQPKNDAHFRDGQAYTLKTKGFFHDPTRIYAPYQRDIVALFSPAQKFVEPLRSVYRRVLQHAGCAHSLVVAIHLVQGDPAELECFSCPNSFRLPLSWYGEWTRHMKHNHSHFLIRAKQIQDKDCPVAPVSDATYAKSLAVAAIMFTDPGYENFGGLTRFGVQRALPIKQVLKAEYGQTDCLPDLPSQYMGEYLDFWLLSQFRVMAASHSTFSLTSAMLSPHINATYPDRDEAFFFRPNAASLNITQFKPWDFHYKSKDFVPFRKQVIERMHALGD